MDFFSKIEKWTYFTCDLDTPAEDFEFHSTIVDVWSQKRDGENLPKWSDFELEDFKEWWGWLSVLDCNAPDGSDWKYRLWGTQIAQFSGHEMTGKAIKAQHSDVVDFRYYNDHDIDHMKILFSQRRIGLLEGPVNTEFPNMNWVSIVRLPLSDDENRITKFLNANTPIELPAIP